MLSFSGLTAIACAIMSLIAGGTSPRIFFASSFEYCLWKSPKAESFSSG